MPNYPKPKPKLRYSEGAKKGWETRRVRQEVAKIAVVQNDNVNYEVDMGSVLVDYVGITLNPNDEFEAVLIQIVETHREKSKMYGSGADPYQNFYDGAYNINTTPLRQCEALLHKHDAALKQWWAKQPLAHSNPFPTHGSDDAFIDRAVYAVIAKVLYNRSRMELGDLS